MKRTCLFAAAMMMALTTTVHAQAPKQEGFELTGNLQHWPNKKVYLAIGRQPDSTLTDDQGNFKFAGSVKETWFNGFYIVPEKGRTQYRTIWLSNRHVDVRGDANAFAEIKVTGSPEQDQFNNFEAFAGEKMKPYYVKFNAAREAKDSVAMKREKKAADALWGPELNRLIAQQVIKYPTSATSVYYIMEVAMSQNYKLADSLLAVMEQHGSELERVKSMRVSMAKLMKMGHPTIGTQAPGFTLPDPQGKQVSLADYRGKYVFVDFWASWCGPCRAENPNVVKVFNKFKDKGLSIVSLSLDDSRDKWLKAVKEDGLPWTQISDLKGPGSDVVMAYGIRAIPSNFLIDPSGKIIAMSLRGAELDAQLSQVIK